MRTTVCLLIFALSSAPVEAIDVSLLAGKLSNCIFELCSTEIHICHRLYGEQLTDTFKVCMKQLCTEKMEDCMDWTIAQKIAVTGVEAIKESFIHCYLNCGFQNRTKYTGCFLEALMDQSQPYISMLAAGSSDPDLMSCWLRQGLGAVRSCFHHYSELSYTLIRNIVHELINNKQEYVTCFMKMYNNGDKTCLQLFIWLFGPTPTLRIRAKDFFICSINEMISLTATC
ncbi:uncharacterized protein LOC128529929 [Clarias gariepinus]|uniref:uncharacterized protein LOC128529929 n=1 Tax=Clarias gariepinus TaxID=13013 RepID=UPI00234D0DD0|nr:uncharacterized protein LOC128529929 [Clarias gariepinus]